MRRLILRRTGFSGGLRTTPESHQRPRRTLARPARRVRPTPLRSCCWTCDLPSMVSLMVTLIRWIGAAQGHGGEGEGQEGQPQQRAQPDEVGGFRLEFGDARDGAQELEAEEEGEREEDEHDVDGDPVAEDGGAEEEGVAAAVGGEIASVLAQEAQDPLLLLLQEDVFHVLRRLDVVPGQSCPKKEPK